MDRRSIVVHMYTLLQSLRRVAILANVSHMTVSRWISNPTKKVYNRNKPTKSDVVIEFLKASLKIDPFTSLAVLRHKVKDAFGFEVSKELIRVVIKRLGLTKKKAKFFSRPDNLYEKTTSFISQRERLKEEGRTFVSIDETSFGRHTRDVFGYSPKGELLVVPRLRPRVTTISALCLIQQGKGDIYFNIRQGSFNTHTFVEFLENLDCPTDTVIILDNVAFHHSKKVKTLAASRGWELLYTPPYSPWFNPIEGVFSIVKRDFYKSQDVYKALSSVKEKHVEAFFRKSLNTISGP